MHPTVVRFIRAMISSFEVTGKRILEVGSLNVNGSLRKDFMKLAPREYVGVDIVPGPGVDRICDAARLVEAFGASSFDTVVSTECLEHVRDWKTAVSQIKRVLKPDGVLLLTTRSPGFPYHPFPVDCWRFTKEDIERIFADMEILVIRPDPEPGVFLKARKPAAFAEADLSGIEVMAVKEEAAP